MIAPSRCFFLVSIVFLLAIPSIRGAQTAEDILKKYDTNGDGQLDEEELGKALKSLGIKVKTPVGKKRAAVGKKLPNAKSATIKAALTNGRVEFHPSQLRYQRRSLQAKYLLDGPTLYRDLTTKEQVVIERAFSDLGLAGLKPGLPAETTSTHGVTPAASATPEASPAATLQMGPVISFLENNFVIRENGDLVNGEITSTDPAKFSWTHSRDTNSYYTIDGAIFYTPSYLDYQWQKVDSDKDIASKQGWIFGARLEPEFEAHVSTQDGSSTNQLKYLLLVQARDKYFPGGDDNKRTESAPLSDFSSTFLSANYFEIAPSYVTDKVAKVQTWGLDGKYQPAIPFLNLNHDAEKTLFHCAWLEGSMQGGIQMTFRDYTAGKAINGMNDSYAEFAGFYQANLKLFGRLTLSASYDGAAIAWGDRKDHEFFKATARLTLDPQDHFSVGATYSYGEQEPTFEKIDSVNAWVGVQF